MPDSPALAKNAFYAQAIGGSGLELSANELAFFARLFTSGITVSTAGVITIPAGGLVATYGNTGLRIFDTDGTHTLTVSPGSNLTANRTLTLTTGDVSRTITLSGDTTLADWFDQAVKVASSPTFVGLTLSGAIATPTNITMTGALATPTTITLSDDVILTANKAIRRNTSDAADSGFIDVGGGGATANTRGAFVRAHGNEHANTGQLLLAAGNVTGSRAVVQVGDGSAALDTNTTGIVALKFSPTQSASANANTLDDYEEGEWTPADGSGAGLSITNNGSQYVKIGQLVVVSLDATYPVTADGSSAVISGLPFTNQTTNGWGGACHSGIAAGLTARVNSAATTVALLNLAGSAVTNATLSSVLVRFVLMYRAAN